MSSSRIYKEISVRIGSSPYMLENIGVMTDVPGKEGEDNVGSRIESIEREAYEKGFVAGEKAGFEFGLQKASALFGGLSGLLDEIASFKESLHKSSEKEMAALAMAIAKKVVQRELEIKNDSVLDSVRAALRAVVAGGEITIKVNPKDHDLLLQYRGELARYGDGVKGVKIESDESVSKGGCIIDTNFGEIDATIESAFSEIEQRLKDAY